MAISNDLKTAPHTEPNDRPPALGDLVSGPEGIFAVCYIGPQNCTGLLVGIGYTGIVDIPLADWTDDFPVRLLVKESIEELVPGSRMQ